jgi:hypothetical protein
VGLFLEGEAAGRPSAPSRSNDGIARAAREFRIEQLRVGEVVAGGDQLISLGELMTSGTRADPGMGVEPMHNCSWEDQSCVCSWR